MATARTTVNFLMDRDLKYNMEKVCREMGLTLATAFTMFAVRVVRDRKIPFDIDGAPLSK